MNNVHALVLSLISQHPDLIAGLLSFVALGLVNGLLPTKVSGTAVTRVVSVLVDRLSPLTRKDARATLKWPIFSASVLRDVADAIDPPQPSKVPPAIPPAEGGYARLGAVAMILATALVVAGLGAVLSGCPRLPPVSGCTPRDYRCTDDGRPQVCSSTQRWQPIGDESCAAAGSVCVVDRTAHCAPHSITLADGGSDAR